MFIIGVIQIVRDAVADLFEKYKTMMQSLAYSILKDHQLSEDAVQEALIRLSQNKEKIGNINSRETKSYIYTVTKNEALRLAEKEINKNNFENDVQFSVDSGFNNIEGQLDIDAFSDENGFGIGITEALKELNKTDKDIIMFKYGAGYTLKEIAGLLNMDKETVYKRHQRALGKLRSVLEYDDKK